MKGIVERFEGAYVIIEIDGQTTDVPREQLDPEAQVGDVVILMNGIWKTDSDATDERAKKIKKMMDRLWED